ncbi:MAG: nucleotidyltransferase family protein [Clostridiales bacterium]|nr:nucleotidyltransferase family protein [Clostridiales bacterium]
MATAIICEFNPFHNGHKYLTDAAHKNGDDTVCIMSGNVVQRGEFAVYDKFTRARTALQNGADLIIELPCVYSLMSARGFAKYSVQIAEATGIVDSLTFGCECGDIETLKKTGGEIKNKKDDIALEMKKGLSYAAARRNIIGGDVLDYPNNTLATEYIMNTSLPCNAVKRIGKGHDSDDAKYSSSAIRSTLKNDEICTLKKCERAVLAKLRSMTSEDFLNIEDVSEGLENRITACVRTAQSLDELYDGIKTKRYTHSRIRRIILRSYLSITKEYSFDAPYIRIIGFNENGRKLLSRMKEKATLPIISKYSDISKLDENGKKLFELECHCTDLYNLGYANIRPCGTEQTSRIVII